MNVFIATLAVSLLGSHDPAWAEAVFDQAVSDCERNRRPSTEQRERMREVYAIEIGGGVPDTARGIMLSALCNESSYVLTPSRGDGGKAVGVLQHWPSHRNGISRVQLILYGEFRGDDAREDWRASAVYWVKKLMHHVPRARRHCRGRRGYRTAEVQTYASANLTSVARPKCVKKRWSDPLQKMVCTKRVPHCARARKFETGHMRRLRRWHLAAMKAYTPRDER